MMRQHESRLFSVLVIVACISPGTYAQEAQTPENLLDEPMEAVVEEAPAEEPVEAPPSTEVDVNEENFRRSMELRDQNLQRSPDLTTGSYSSSTAQRALENLPEESQKHLREQMREVIVENGPWMPEDAGAEYPYVPSERAERNGSLQNREQAAWGEMVAEYHEREAAIHANAERIEAATAAADQSGQSGQPGQPGGGETGGAPMEQGSSSGSANRESSEDNARAERSEALAEMLNSSQSSASSSNPQDIPPTENGTEQNALELLTQRDQIPAEPASQSAEAMTASVDISQASAQSESGDAGEEAQDPSLEISSDDVIAIEDLDKVRVDPQAQDDNPD